MRIEIKTKYCKIAFDEYHEKGHNEKWATVEFVYGEKPTNKAEIFGILMDTMLRDQVRAELGNALEIDAMKDIYLEDTWLMINSYTDSSKHHLARLFSIVQRVEARFDEMVSVEEEDRQNLLL